MPTNICLSYYRGDLAGVIQLTILYRKNKLNAAYLVVYTKVQNVEEQINQATKC